MNKRTRKVYKLVARGTLGGLVSAVTSRPTLGICVDKEYPFCLVYSKRRWTKPKVGKIFAFGSLRPALSYKSVLIASGDDVELWEAQATGVKSFADKVIPYVDQFEDFGAFWRKAVSGFHNSSPQGTVLCDSLKLVREIL